MGNINIDYYNLSKYSKQFDDYSNNLKRQIDNLLKKTEDLKTYWTGSQNATNYIQTMQEKIIAEMRKINEILNSYGNYIKNVSEAYKSLEDTFSNKKIEIR